VRPLDPVAAAALAAAAPRVPTNVVVPYVKPPRPARHRRRRRERRRRLSASRALSALGAAPGRGRAGSDRARREVVVGRVARAETAPSRRSGSSPAASSFESPEPAIVFAEVSSRGRAVRPKSIRGTLTTESLEPLAEVDFHDDGADGDAARRGRPLQPYASRARALGGALSTSYLVQVRAEIDGDDDRSEGPPRASPTHRRTAHLTGGYRDQLVDGEVSSFGVEVDVAEPGRFHVEATLYGPDGADKIAWAQAAQWLEPGRHGLDLSYYGLILREHAVDGPYVLRYVALSTTTEMPNAMNRVVENPYTDRELSRRRLHRHAVRRPRSPRSREAALSRTPCRAASTPEAELVLVLAGLLLAADDAPARRLPPVTTVCRTPATRNLLDGDGREPLCAGRGVSDRHRGCRRARRARRLSRAGRARALAVTGGVG